MKYNLAKLMEQKLKQIRKISAVAVMPPPPIPLPPPALVAYYIAALIIYYYGAQYLLERVSSPKYKDVDFSNEKEAVKALEKILKEGRKSPKSPKQPKLDPDKVNKIKDILKKGQLLHEGYEQLSEEEKMGIEEEVMEKTGESPSNFNLDKIDEFIINPNYDKDDVIEYDEMTMPEEGDGDGYLSTEGEGEGESTEFSPGNVPGTGPKEDFDIDDSDCAHVYMFVIQYGHDSQDKIDKEYDKLLEKEKEKVRDYYGDFEADQLSGDYWLREDGNNDFGSWIESINNYKETMKELFPNFNSEPIKNVGDAMLELDNFYTDIAEKRLREKKEELQYDEDNKGTFRDAVLYWGLGTEAEGRAMMEELCSQSMDSLMDEIEYYETLLDDDMEPILSIDDPAMMRNLRTKRKIETKHNMHPKLNEVSSGGDGVSVVEICNDKAVSQEAERSHSKSLYREKGIERLLSGSSNKCIKICFLSPIIGDGTVMNQWKPFRSYYVGPLKDSLKRGVEFCRNTGSSGGKTAAPVLLDSSVCKTYECL